MADKYTDTKDLHKIMDEIRASPTLGSVKDIVDREYPDFIKGLVLTGFSDDYPVLRQNWLQLCDLMKTTPKQIMIVDTWEPDDDHVLIRYVTECFTKAGFLVRCTSEIVPCIACKKALPSNEYYDAMKKAGVTTLPQTWSNRCLNCGISK